MERKLYACEKCNRKVPIRSKKLCPRCREEQRKLEGTLPKKTYRIKPISDKRKKERKEERNCLNAFFQFHLINLMKNPRSIESGVNITEPTTANICHLLPKRKSGGFPSVQCHLDNAIYLTLQEHNRFDKLLDERDYEKLEKEFPNSWKHVCKKFVKLLKTCTERNKMYLSLTEYLKI